MNQNVSIWDLFRLVFLPWISAFSTSDSEGKNCREQGQLHGEYHMQLVVTYKRKNNWCIHADMLDLNLTLCTHSSQPKHLRTK